MTTSTNSNEGKIVSTQVLPHEAEQTLPEGVVPLWALSCSQTESASFNLTYRVT